MSELKRKSRLETKKNIGPEWHHLSELENEIREHGTTKNTLPELTIKVKGLEVAKKMIVSELTIKNDGLKATKFFLSELTIKIDWRKATNRTG